MKTASSNKCSSTRPDGSIRGRQPAAAIHCRARLFGPEFADPNAADFKPNPGVMARRSVLSAVAEQRKALDSRVGARDRERLDQYFTALRQTEQQQTDEMKRRKERHRSR